jgi:hypothetical protein
VERIVHQCRAKLQQYFPLQRGLEPRERRMFSGEWNRPQILRKYLLEQFDWHRLIHVEYHAFHRLHQGEEQHHRGKRAQRCED